jgi:hypothetical protein
MLIAFSLVGCGRREGKVLNIAESTPIAGATIFHDGETTQSDANGQFKLTRCNVDKPVLVRATGFRSLSLPRKKHLAPDARLQRFDPKALYLSHAGVGAEYLREPVFKLLEETDLNAVVVDIKGTRGLISFNWEVPLGHEIGAFSKLTIEDPDAFVAELHKKNIYIIGRISVFKDDALGYHKPQFAAIEIEKGKPYRDHEKIVWLDPFQEAVWDYNLALAKGAAELGFDEILFDNVRFPPVSPSRIKLSKENTRESRVETVTSFLRRAKTELAPYGVFVSAAMSGMTLWHKGDSDVGQDIEAIAPIVDYVWPYIYPSEIYPILPSAKNEPDAPHRAVSHVLNMSLQRVGTHREKIRPWLQGFRDYTKGKREFKEQEIAMQMAACRDAGVNGWVFFNPENKYPFLGDAMRLAENGFTVTNQIEQAER